MKKTNKSLLYILIISVLIIFIASLEALFNAKSLEIFNLYKTIYPYAKGSDFLNFVLINYLYNIVEPIVISIFLLVTHNKIKVNNLYRIVFAGMVLIRIVNLVFSFNINSIFYYLLIINYFILFIFIIRYKN